MWGFRTSKWSQTTRSNFGDFPLKISRDTRDDNGFSIAEILMTSFVTHFDVLKLPIGWTLTTFSKTTSKKRQNATLSFTL